MERAKPDTSREKHTAVFVIVRDVVIFAVFMAGAVLISLGAAGAAGSTTTSAAQTTSPDGAAQVVEVAAAGSTQTAPTLTATPGPTATPEPTQAPTANGDFSSVFPAYDTGSGAYLSHQSDTLRVAIQKVQGNDVTYFVADVWVKNIDVFATAFAKGSYGRGLHEMPLKIAQDNGAVFAVSGDYYGAREQGVVVRNGTLYRDVMGDDVCVLKRDGTLNVYRKGSFSPLSDIDETVWQAWAFGPILVENGVASDTSDSRIKVKNPRSAIGYYEPGHYCFIVVDGRQSGYSDGMTLDELAQTFVRLGCKTAYNLDGGATAMMVLEGAVVNQPTNGGRSSSDIICFS